MSAIQLLRELIKASEKAANIARVCRKDEHLFGLLIQEKPKDEANTRFEHDFKTLADCLIQETVKYDIGKLVIWLSRHLEITIHEKISIVSRASEKHSRRRKSQLYQCLR